jgi:hypothetical protein
MKRPVIIGFLAAATLLVLAGIAAVVYFTVREGGFNFDANPVSATAEESQTLKVDVKEQVTLSVDDDAGRVTVVGAEVEAVEVKVIKTGNAGSQSDAEEDLENIRYEIQQTGNVIRLLYKLDGVRSNHIDTVDFIVTVPVGTTAEIETNLGAVEVANLKGDVNISNDFGDVSVRDVEGALALENSSGAVIVIGLNANRDEVTIDADFGDITLENITGGNVTITSNSGAVTLNDIRASGDVYIKSDFGDTTYEGGSAAALTVESSSGKTVVTNVNVRGALVIACDFGEVILSQTLAGSYDLDSDSGNIFLEGVKNGIKAHTDFGNISVSDAQNVTIDLSSNSGVIDFSGSLGDGPHLIKSDFGGIILSLPADSQLNVELKTDFGNIESALPITIVTTGNSEKSRMVGKINGGGAQLTATTNSGNITIVALGE